MLAPADVDNLESVEDLSTHVADSQALLLLLGSPKYMSSANCQLEATTAKQRNLPVVRCHDADGARQGSSASAVGRTNAGDKSRAIAELRGTAERHVLSRSNASFLFGPQDAEWIPWHFVAAFQQVSLAKIAEHLLLASPAYAHESALPLYITGGLAYSPVGHWRPPTLYISPQNPPASKVANELRATELFQELPPIASTLDCASRWLLVLRADSFEGVMGARLVDEVEAALMRDVSPVLMYCSEEVEFEEIIAATPKRLRQGGLFGPLAIEWRGGLHRLVSEKMLAKALGARFGERTFGEAARDCLQICTSGRAPAQMPRGWSILDGRTCLSRTGKLLRAGRGHTSSQVVELPTVSVKSKRIQSADVSSHEP